MSAVLSNGRQSEGSASLEGCRRRFGAVRPFRALRWLVESGARQRSAMLYNLDKQRTENDSRRTKGDYAVRTTGRHLTGGDALTREPTSQLLRVSARAKCTHAAWITPVLRITMLSYKCIFQSGHTLMTMPTGDWLR